MCFTIYGTYPALGSIPPVELHGAALYRRPPRSLHHSVVPPFSSVPRALVVQRVLGDVYLLKAVVGEAFGPIE